MFLKTKLTYLIFLFALFFGLNFQAQEKLACIEFDKNHLKVLLVEVKDKKSKDLKLRNFWIQNLTGDPNNSNALADGLINVVKKLNVENNIDNNHIYLISENQLFSEDKIISIQKKLESINFKNIDFLSSSISNQLLYDSLITEDKSVLINSNANHSSIIGNATDEKKNTVFQIIPFLEANHAKVIEADWDQNVQLNKLESEINTLFNRLNFVKKNQNFYIVGDWGWAFNTLYNAGGAPGEFVEIKLEDLAKYQDNLMNRFSRYQGLATANIDAERVLSNYSQKELIAGNLILVNILKGLPDVFNKKVLYFKNYNKARQIQYLKNKL